MEQMASTMYEADWSVLRPPECKVEFSGRPRVFRSKENSHARGPSHRLNRRVHRGKDGRIALHVSRIGLGKKKKRSRFMERKTRGE